MEMYLQFGWGMMEHCRILIQEWGGGTVILSPRDLNHSQLVRFAGGVQNLQGGAVLLDPQFYLPHSNHDRLSGHDYWPAGYSTGTFYSGPQLYMLIAKLISLNNRLGTREFILPGLYATNLDAQWFSTQQTFLDEARRQGVSRPLCQTIAISSDVCRLSDNIGRLIDFAERDRVDSYYIVCEHPRDAYLVSDSTWMANLLDLVAGLKLLGSRVILGYSSHQTLIAATAKVDAIAAGTWMNVRAFTPGKFDPSQDEEMRRAVWYYSPKALSEYKITTLDTALRVGVLNLLAPPPPLLPEIARLFTGVQPSTLNLAEQTSFRHYLTQLRLQTVGAVLPTFDGTITAYETLLDNTENLLTTLHASGIRGAQRDFSEALEANREALAVLRATRAGILRRRWTSL